MGPVEGKFNSLLIALMPNMQLQVQKSSADGPVKQYAEQRIVELQDQVAALLGAPTRM